MNQAGTYRLLGVEEERVTYSFVNRAGQPREAWGHIRVWERMAASTGNGDEGAQCMNFPDAAECAGQNGKNWEDRT